MDLKPKPYHYFQWLGATLAAVLTTVGLAMTNARATTAGMVFLMVVVVTATQAGMVISLYSALLCAVSFDYFFLPPIHTFILAGPQEWVSMLTFAVSSLGIGLRMKAITSRWDAWGDFPLVKPGTERIAIIALVSG